MDRLHLFYIIYHIPNRKETSEKQNWPKVLLKFKDDLFLNPKEPEGKLSKVKYSDLYFVYSTLHILTSIRQPNDKYNDYYSIMSGALQNPIEVA